MFFTRFLMKNSEAIKIIITPKKADFEPAATIIVVIVVTPIVDIKKFPLNKKNGRPNNANVAKSFGFQWNVVGIE